MADVVIQTICSDLTDAEMRRDDLIDDLRRRGYEASWQYGERGTYEVTGVRHDPVPTDEEVAEMAEDAAGLADRYRDPWDGDGEVS